MNKNNNNRDDAQNTNNNDGTNNNDKKEWCCPYPQLHLEQFLLKELPSSEMEEIERAYRSDGHLRRHIEALRESNADILSRYQPRHIAHRILMRFENITPLQKSTTDAISTLLHSLRPLALSILVCTVVLAGSIFYFVTHYQQQQSVSLAVRLKGGAPYLHVYRKTASKPEKLSSGDRVSTGDTLQISYNAMGRLYGVIISIDGRAGVTLHFPETQTDTTALLPNNEHFLPRSYELDDAPDFERFFFITSQVPLVIDEIMASATHLAQSDSAQTGQIRLFQKTKTENFSLVVRKD
ncbi:MAG: hypothetical protein JW795_09430 [Chitinivibrionales bacterium]|nr:hypothetical protein [Chitinivibrionales bacterium]